jgi:uncharacterized lipoprotein YmbA
MPRLPLALAAVLALSGCAGTSPPTHFYALDSAGGAQALARLPDLSLGLGPIVLPDTLDRPQIVTRAGPYRLKLAEFHRWAGDLKGDLARTLAQRLSARLGTERLFLHPWPRHRQPTLQVRIDVLRLEGRPGGEAELSGNWTLLDGEGRQERYLEAFDLRESVSGTEFRDLVAAYSRLSDRLADRIAQGVAQRVQRSHGKGKG